VNKNIPEKLVLREMVADCAMECRSSKRKVNINVCKILKTA
jgi:hypothetical protein